MKLPVSPKQITRDLFVRDALLGSDALRAAGEFSEPAVAGDLALFSVPDSDIVALSECTPDDCRLRLGEKQLAALRAIDWEASDAQQQVDALVRREILELVQAYQADGRAALARHVGRPDAGSVPDVTGVPLTGMSSRKLVDSVRAFLREYPGQKGPETRSRLHWNVRPYGYRPVTSIVHTVAVEPGRGQPAVLIAAETLYASHYFDARLQLLGLYTDTENPDQTWAVYGERLLFGDELGTIQRRLLRRAVLANIEERLGRVVEEYRSS